MLKSVYYEKYLKSFFTLMEIPEKQKEIIETLIKKGRDVQIGDKDWKKVYFITESIFEFCTKGENELK